MDERIGVVLNQSCGDRVSVGRVSCILVAVVWVV